MSAAPAQMNGAGGFVLIDGNQQRAFIAASAHQTLDCSTPQPARYATAHPSTAAYLAAAGAGGDGTFHHQQRQGECVQMGADELFNNIMLNIRYI